MFAVDLGSYSVLSNHLHLIVRTRPDIVAGWSDQQVACRWKMAWPQWDDGQWHREPSDEEIQQLCQDPAHVALARQGLSSLSWFLARCKEPIARLANQQMDRRGHFWEQRYSCRELCDEQAVLTCMVYVDINQIQAGMAASLQQSRCSAIADRLAAWRQREAEASVEVFRCSRSREHQLELQDVQLLLADCWLAPITSDAPLMTPSQVTEPQPALATQVPTGPQAAVGTEKAEPQLGNEPATTTPRSPGPRRPTKGKPSDKRSTSTTVSRTVFDALRNRGRRASDNCILDMPSGQYGQLVLWAADQARSDRSASAPPQPVAACLHQRGLDPKRWSEAVLHFESWFHRVVGSSKQLAQWLKRNGRRWLHGIRYCRDTFG